MTQPSPNTTPPADAPYGLGLVAPLNDVQAKAIAAWLTAHGSYAVSFTGTAPNRVWHFTPTTAGQPAVANETDTQLLAGYYQAFGTSGNQGKVDTQLSIPGVTTVEDFLSMLTNPNTWIRVGEFAAGFLLLGIGTYVILKGSGNTPKLPTPGRVVSDGLKSKRTSAARRQSFQYQETGRDAQFRRTETSRDLAVMRRQNRPAAPKITPVRTKTAVPSGVTPIDLNAPVL